MSIESLADKTVTIQRASMSVTAAGAYEEVFEEPVDWKARIQPLTAAELTKLGREATEVGIKLYGIPDGIQEPDRITYGSRTFRVLGVRDIDEQGRLATVDCIEVL